MAPSFWTNNKAGPEKEAEACGLIEAAIKKGANINATFNVLWN